MAPINAASSAITTNSRSKTAASTASSATSTRINGSSTAPTTDCRVAMNSDYIELRARSAFSFLEGASTPEDLAARAAELGYSAMALGDRDGVYGAPRFYLAAKSAGIRQIVGAELTLDDDSRLYVLAPDRQRYQNLCRMITDAKMRVLNPRSEER